MSINHRVVNVYLAAGQWHMSMISQVQAEKDIAFSAERQLRWLESNAHTLR